MYYVQKNIRDGFMTQNSTTERYSPIKIILFYLLIGGLWIVLTDYKE